MTNQTCPSNFQSHHPNRPRVSNHHIRHITAEENNVIYARICKVPEYEYEAAEGRVKPYVYKE